MMLGMPLEKEVLDFPGSRSLDNSSHYSFHSSKLTH